MIKIKIFNPLAGKNRISFQGFVAMRDMLRDYSIELTESDDFDYVGMLKYSAEMEIPEDPNTLLSMVEVLNKLFDSYEDVNYHSEARDLGIAIDYIEDAKGIEDLERAQDLLVF